MQPRNVRVVRAGLIAFAIVVPAFCIGLILSSAVQDHRDTLEKAELEARSTSAVLIEHANRTIGEADLFLLGALGEIERSKLSATVNNESALQLVLQKYNAKLPQLLSINLVDNNGLIVATGFDNPASVVVNDRDYFRYHSIRGNTGLFISHPMQGRFSDRWVFTISRSIANADGSLKMLLVACVPVSYFDTFYQSLVSRKDTHMLLVHRDGTVLVENPESNPPVVRSIRGDALFAHYQKLPTGSFRSKIEAYDGAPQVVGYSGSSDYPLVAVASLSEAEVLAPWHKWVTRSAIIGLFAIWLLLALIALLWGRLDELLSGKVNLVEKNESLALAAQMLEKNVNATLILSADGTILSANKVFSDITGYAKEEMVGRNVSRFEASVVEADMRTTIVQALQSSGSWHGDACLLTKSGGKLMTKQSISILRGADGSVKSIVAVFQNITEQKLNYLGRDRRSV